MDKKRILLAAIFITTSIAIGATLYFFFFKPLIGTPTEEDIFIEVPSQLPTSGEATEFTTTDELSEFLPDAESIDSPTGAAIAQGGITTQTVVTNNKNIGLTASADGNGIALYDSEAGKFYTIDNQGNQKLLSNETFFNVESIAWSPNQEKAVIEYPDGFNVVYDFETDTQITLPQHWEKFQFSKNGTKISAIAEGIHRSQNWLLTVNPDGSQARGIEPLGDNANKVIPSWNPNSNIVAFSKTGEPVGGEANEIYLIGRNNENYKSLIVDGYGFQPKWSDEGSSLLYSTHSSLNDYKPLIWVVDANGTDVGGNRRELGLTTWAEKCTFEAKTSIICAVPNNLERGAGFAPEVADNVADTFYKVDINTGLKTQLAVPEAPVNAQSLSITTDGQFLYYQNTFSGSIEKIKLK